MTQTVRNVPYQLRSLAKVQLKDLTQPIYAALQRLLTASDKPESLFQRAVATLNAATDDAALGGRNAPDSGTPRSSGMQHRLGAN